MNENNYLFVSYIFNMLSNTVGITLLSLGVWYLLDASNVEFMKIPVKVAIVSLIPNVIQLAFCIAKDCSIKTMLISGFIALIISAIINMGVKA